MKKSVLKGSSSMKDEVRDIIDTVVESQAGEVVRKIGLTKVKIRENVRKEYREIETMASSIEEKGLLQPITVKPVDGGFYEILFGHRRYKAYCHLKEKHPGKYLSIEAIVKDEKSFDAEEIKEIQLVENIQRENLSAVELKESLEYLKKKGLSHKDIAKKIGKAEGYVKHVFSAIKAVNKNEELSELIKSDVDITLADIHEVKVLPYRDQVKLIKDRIKGQITSVKELRQKVSELRERSENFNRSQAEKKHNAPFFEVRGDLLKVRSFSYDPEKHTESDKADLVEKIKEVLKLLEARS